MSRANPSTGLPRLAARRSDSHKGDFGRALLIGGSQGMAGAIALSGLACLRSGAGLVKIATAAVCQPTVAGFEPAIMTLALSCDPAGRIVSAARDTIFTAAADATALALGPGLGRSEELVDLVAWLYENIEQPMVVDADALNALALHPAVLERPSGPRVLTPHPGEFARLLRRPRIEDHQRESLAVEFAKRAGAVVVLKGHHSVVTDGMQTALNSTGNPGMATGGTGDVLTGMITAMLCQGLAPYEAARLGAHVHGLAGDLAATEFGEVAMIASDVVACLPRAWQQLA